MKSLKLVWAAAQHPPSRSEKEKARISEEPKATIEIPVQNERISAIIAEILLLLYQNQKRRLSAPV